MKVKLIISLFLISNLTACGLFGGSGPSAEIATNGAIGTVAGAGIGALVGATISNGDVASSALVGAGAGLVVGAVGTYAYKKIKVRNEIIGNDESIESNRVEILSKQSELDRMRAAAFNDSRDFEFDKSRTEKVYDGATLGVYYR